MCSLKGQKLVDVLWFLFFSRSPVACDIVGLFLVELIVSLSSDIVYRELFKKLFIGKLHQYAAHLCASELIRNCPDKETMVI